VPTEAGSPPQHTIDVAELLDPIDVQTALKLRSRRSARELIVREMEHILVGRTPMTTTVWLSEWIERQRRTPRERGSRPREAGAVAPIAGVRGTRRRQSLPVVPRPRRRAKAG
jgi:hypothetical protein